MTVLPKPLQSGGRTGGPLRSAQLMVKVSSAIAQSMSTRPISVENAPYFPALVESSWSASPMAWAAAAFQRNFGPNAVIRDNVPQSRQYRRTAEAERNLESMIAEAWPSYRRWHQRRERKCWMRWGQFRLGAIPQEIG
jgi:hypothetical protein